MWNELECYKNHFLQWRFPTFKAQTLNEMVQKEFKIQQYEHEMCCFPHEDVECNHSTYFDDRSKLAYGFWALPQLMKEACSDTSLTQWRAINSLSELIMNPLEAQRAITEVDIVRKIQNIFLRKRHKYKLEYYREIEKMMKIFYTVSLYLNGALKMVIKRHLLKEFYIMIYNKEEYMEIASKVLRNLSEKSKVLLHMLEETEAFDYLTTIFHKDECAQYYPLALWMHLSHFLEVSPERGIERGFFELLHKRILNRLPLYYEMNMKCFALLLQCADGQRMFDDVEGVKLMYRLFTKDAPLLDTWEYVVLAFQNAIVSKRTLWRCCEHMDIAEILVRLARPKPIIGQGDENEKELCADNNTRLQLYCLQALRKMGQMPRIKRYIHDVCLPGIRAIDCLNELNECTRDDLVKWLKREVYHTEMEYY